jgi:DNA primase
MARDAVSEVRERTDIVELIGRYVTLKKAGRSFKGLCPFHGEKTPSFIVFPDSQNFHCFGCGRGGDAFSFLMGVENLEFKDALTELAERAGVQVTPSAPVNPEVDAHRQRLLELNELAAAFYANVLATSPAGARGRELVQKRGVSDAMVSRFRLGFAPDGWEHLLKFLSDRGVDPATAAEAGLLQHRDSGGWYDRFRNRLLFPISDRDGRVVGFGGRALGDEQPKYLNSPRTPLFDKSTLVYGIDLARESARKHDQVVIVEGYMDVIAAHQFGYENVVAAMGTALTDSQVAAVKRLSKRIVLALDADAAGQMATVRSLEAMQDALDHDAAPVVDPGGIIRFERKLNAEISIVQLPEGKDPDELIRKNPESWPGVVESAKPFLDFYINAVVGPTPVESPTAKAEIVGRIGPLLRQIPDRIIQAHYVDLLAARLRIDSRLVNAEIRRGSFSRVNAPPDPERTPAASLARFRQPKHASNEDHLMALLLRHRSLCRDIIAIVPAGDLTDERNRELLAVLQSDDVPDLEPLQIIAGLDDWLADYAETLLAQLEGTPSLLPGQIQREAQRTLDKLGKERYDFLVRELSAELQEASKSGDLETIARLAPQLDGLRERNRLYYPPKSPYFKDARDSQIQR